MLLFKEQRTQIRSKHDRTFLDKEAIEIEIEIEIVYFQYHL